MSELKIQCEVFLTCVPSISVQSFLPLGYLFVCLFVCFWLIYEASFQHEYEQCFSIFRYFECEFILQFDPEKLVLFLVPPGIYPLWTLLLILKNEGFRLSHFLQNWLHNLYVPV